jgi:alpha-galactosidase
VATTDRSQVLKDATVVIATIGVGGRRAWEHDVFIPRKYGISMPVGDTVGPGGTSRALRMIPAMIEIARDVADFAPDALFFNYANPMSPICFAVHKIVGVPMMGLCIGTWHTVLYIADILGVEASDLSYSASGINHLTWFTEIVLKGQDLKPKLKNHANQVVQSTQQAIELAKQDGAALPHTGSPFDSSFKEPFSWQCMLWFDAFPSPGDRHITEFFPQFFREGHYFGKKLGIDEFSFENTIAIGDKIFYEMQQDALGPNPLSQDYFLKQGGEQEQVVEILQAIENNQTKTFFANLPNTGQAPDLPIGAVIETPAVTDNRGIHPIQQTALPLSVAGMLASRFSWVETITEAALLGSREFFVQALILDGAISSPDVAVKMADELLNTHAEFLPNFV